MKLLLLLSMLATAVFAETFGGIGVTIQSSEKGVQVVTVIPGSIASEKNLEAGDQILAVNGKSLQGLPLEQATALLRGEAGSAAELSVLKVDGAMWAGQLTRIGLQIEPLSTAGVGATLGQTEGLTAAEISYYAGNQAQSGYTLLGVLQQGRLVQEDTQIAPNMISAVYTGKAELVKAPKTVLGVGSISFQGLTRQIASFNLESSGMTDVKLLDVQGKQIASWHVEAAQGNLKLNWEGKTQPRGAYNLLVKQGTSQQSFSTTLD